MVKRWSALIGIVLVAVAAMLLARCDERPECPHQGFLETRDTLNFLNSPPSASGPITGVPEYHDCQRFILADSGKLRYDSLYAIFARYRLKEAFAAAMQTNPRGLVLAATIASYGGTYDPLHLKPGVSCLYIQPLLGQADSLEVASPGPPFRAFMYYNGLGRTNGTCPDSTGVPVSDLMPLAVQATPLDKRDAALVPAVARWDWDEGRNEQYLGIWCPLHWCEIGREGFTRSAPLPIPAGTSPEMERVYRYKGYYDRQLLAVKKDSRLVPSGMMGVVLPHYELGSRNYADYSSVDGTNGNAAVYVHAVYMDVTGDEYSDKFLRLLPGQLNVVSAHAVNESSGTAEARWTFSARLSSADGQTTNLHAKFRPHPETAEFKVPPTARWRWRKDDETVWFACVSGCCEVCPPSDPKCNDS